MNTKRMIVGMLLALVLLMGWHFFVYQLAKKNNWDLNPAPATQPAASPVAESPRAPAGAATAATGIAEQTSSGNTPSLLVVPAGGQIGSVSLGSAQMMDSRFVMGLELSNRGAAITQATLNRFKREPVGDENPRKVKEPFVFQQPARGAGHAAMATRALIVLDPSGDSAKNHRIDLEDKVWKIDSSDGQQATMSLDLADADGKPLLRLHKTFSLAGALAENGKDPSPSRGYEVAVRLGAENLSATAIKVQFELAGPIAPPRQSDRSTDISVVAGYGSGVNTKLPIIEPLTTAVGSIKSGEAKELSTHAKNLPLIWSGLSSTYFEAIVLPSAPDGQATDFIKFARAELLNPGDPAIDHVAGLNYTTQPLTVEPKTTRGGELRLFLGPKSRELLDTPYYSDFPRNYALTLAVTGGCSICTFQWLVDSMVWLLDLFHGVLRDWGLAIIALVILVRLVLHPITKKSTISMQKMSKLGPEMERLKKKYGDNKEELNRAMMQFYKEHGATPVLGCLPMFLQMPIWIALWSSLQSTFELWQAPFLWGFTWIHDLSRADRLVYFPNHAINLFLFQVDAINLLPLLMGVVFFLQQKYTPKPAAMTPEQEQQQKMMQWMTLLFPVMLYNGPSGLNLYILTSTTIGILESKRIRDQIKVREAAETAGGRVIIDVEPTQVAKRRAGQKPAGGVAGLLEKAQQWAEDIRKQRGDKK